MLQGLYTVLRGLYTVLQGLYTVLQGLYTVLQGLYTVLQGLYTVLRGLYTVLQGLYTVLQGLYTVLQGLYTVLQGLYASFSFPLELKCLPYHKLLAIQARWNAALKSPLSSFSRHCGSLEPEWDQGMEESSWVLQFAPGDVSSQSCW